MSVDTIQRYRFGDIYRVTMSLEFIKAVDIDGRTRQSYSQPRTLKKQVLGLAA